MTRTLETPRKSRKACVQATFKFYGQPEPFGGCATSCSSAPSTTTPAASVPPRHRVLPLQLPQEAPGRADRDQRRHKRASEIARLYKAHLKAYSKREFDLFCREGRREIKIGNVTVRSNEPQLNLFYFLQKHNLIHVITQKFDEINRVRAESRNEVKA